MSQTSSQGLRVCVIGAGPCGLTAVKNLLAAGLTDIVCYDEGSAIGGNWVYSDDEKRVSVYASTHLISSRTLSEFEDFPMPESYPDYPSHRQMRAYFESYAEHFGVATRIQFKTRVERAAHMADGRWSVRVSAAGAGREEQYDWLLVCSGHHRAPFVPDYPGRFTGQMLHSQAYRRPEPFRDKRVLVVGAGNSACDIAVDLARAGGAVSISIRRGCYIVPKIIFGKPLDMLYEGARKLPRFMLPPLMRAMARIVIGRWERYGLQAPVCGPTEIHPTISTNFLSALRDGTVTPRVGIDHFDGDMVHFADGGAERFDAIIWGTGFRTAFPFLDASVVDWDTSRRPPLYRKMMHPRIENLFFIGLFQPLGCIWRLADHQARIAALQITGQLDRPRDIAARIDHEVRHPHWNFQDTPRHALEVDALDFRKELLAELRGARAVEQNAA